MFLVHSGSIGPVKVQETRFVKYSLYKSVSSTNKCFQMNLDMMKSIREGKLFLFGHKPFSNPRSFELISKYIFMNFIFKQSREIPTTNPALVSATHFCKFNINENDKHKTSPRSGRGLVLISENRRKTCKQDKLWPGVRCQHFYIVRPGRGCRLRVPRPREAGSGQPRWRSGWLHEAAVTRTHPAQTQQLWGAAPTKQTWTQSFRQLIQVNKSPNPKPEDCGWPLNSSNSPPDTI